MIVLGISGLENSVNFKKAKWPGLDEREYRISQGHDSAAALLVDGVVIAAVQAGGPADNAGLQEGDVITSFNGKPVTAMAQLRTAIRALKPGQSADVSYVSGGFKKRTQIKIAGQWRGGGLGGASLGGRSRRLRNGPDHSLVLACTPER